MLDPWGKPCIPPYPASLDLIYWLADLKGLGILVTLSGPEYGQNGYKDPGCLNDFMDTNETLPQSGLVPWLLRTVLQVLHPGSDGQCRNAGCEWPIESKSGKPCRRTHRGGVLNP